MKLTGLQAGPVALVLGSVLVLTGAVGALAWEVLELKHELRGRPPGVSFQAVESLLETRLEGCLENSYQIGEADSRFVLLFLLSPYDCPICHEELMGLQVLSEKRPNLDVYAVMSSASADEACQTQSNFGLAFPVLLDPDGHWRQRLGPPETPWKVLVETGRDRVRILLEDPKSSTPAQREAFQHRLRVLTAQ